MKNSGKKKKLLGFAAVLAIIAVLSGTFAWLTAQDQRINRAEAVKVSDDSVSIVEKWEPIKLISGQEAKKEVSVTNSGEARVFVRLSYEEVLKHLVDNGAVKYGPSATAGVKYVYVADDSGLGKHMPVDTSVQKSLDNGFTFVSDGQVTGLEPGTKLLAKGTRKFNDLDQEYHTSYEIKLVHEYYTHPDNVGKIPGAADYDASKNLYQMMTTEHNITDYNSNSENAYEWDYTLTNLQYAYYEDGYQSTVVNWANSTLPEYSVDNTGSVTGHALLGTVGKRHGVDYDYTPAALGISSIPQPSPATAADQIPVRSANEELHGVQADMNGFGEDKIRIKYGTDITDNTGTGIEDGKWFYNVEDGWFYYTSPLNSGASTPDLLKALIFSNNMGDHYKNASYDLIVKMEAIQATPEALTSDTGWNLGNGNTPTGDTLDIYNQLTKGM